MTKLPVEFDTRPFLRSHMVEPKGHGSWAFAVESENSADAFFTPCMTFAEAKKYATAKVRAEAPAGARCARVNVLP